MKRLLLCFLLCCGLLLSSAHAEVETIFDQDFFVSTGIWRDEHQLNPQTFSAVGSGRSVWAILHNDGSVWRWDADTGDYEYVVTVPMAKMTEKPLNSLSASEREYQLTSVTDLIGADGKLYGFNALSGRLGLIDEQGVHWNEVTLDTAPALKRDTGYPSCHFCPTIVGDRLYLLCDLVLTMGGSGYRPALVSCKLDGSDTQGDVMPGLISLCRYDDAHLLLLTMTGLELYDTATAQTTHLPLILPATVPQSGDFWDVHSALGGLAYDPARDTIFLATTTALYTSTAGGAFVERASDMDWHWAHSLESAHPATVLDNGTYILYADGLTTFCVQP